MKNSLQPWDITSSRTIHTTPWLSVIEDTCQVGSKSLIYTYVKRVDEGPLIIPEHTDGKLWLVRQYRHPVKKIIWQFPVEGKLKDESWEAAAKRGLHEELGIEAKSWQNLGELYPDPGSLEQKFQVFLAKNLSTIPESSTSQSNEEIEDLETGLFSRAEIETLITSGEICDNWTLAALYLYDRAHSQSI